MARSRQYIDDIVYAEEHRNVLPRLYIRIGHRLDMADRDFTEFCHHCKQPIAIIELVSDVGQDLKDKGIRVTANLSSMAGIPGYCVAYTVDRPPAVQAEIDSLGKDIMRLQTQYPIRLFKVRQINPMRSSFHTMSPNEYWEHVLLLHRDHHRVCDVASQNEIKVNGRKLEEHKSRSPLIVPIQKRLDL